MVETDSLIDPLSPVLSDVVHAGLTRLTIAPGTLDERLLLWAQTRGAIRGQTIEESLMVAFGGAPPQSLSDAESAFYIAAGSSATATLNRQRHDYWSTVTDNGFASPRESLKKGVRGRVRKLRHSIQLDITPT